MKSDLEPLLGSALRACDDASPPLSHATRRLLRLLIQVVLELDSEVDVLIKVAGVDL